MVYNEVTYFEVHYRLMNVLLSCSETLSPAGNECNGIHSCYTHPTHQSWPRLCSESADQRTGTVVACSDASDLKLLLLFEMFSL